jgi:hypothetical protein
MKSPCALQNSYISTTMTQSASDSASEISTSSSRPDGLEWEVQDILAERTSILSGKELLVVWKTSWVPKDTVQINGPIMTHFRSAPKTTFVSAAGNISWVVEPGTQLARDVAHVCAVAATARDKTPRKQLDSDAKRCRH